MSEVNTKNLYALAMIALIAIKMHSKYCITKYELDHVRKRKAFMKFVGIFCENVKDFEKI
ncbi:CLUMA_CG009090, isoform A [Clunio marinus]|uniref:CLUMA_CG009090, isoform A n=1 Tax=Clunio marinus TaxID=568069 RepID=A0A1J1I5T5_9DIPT|nr:CLUMA_CG009090, isoform A [Clunio marinus]